MPALTVIANLAVTLAQNAIPVFVDIDPDSFNMDMDDLKSKITDEQMQWQYPYMVVHVTTILKAISEEYNTGY